MKDIAIVVAESEGGLDGALKNTGYIIIPATTHQFTSLTTFPDGPSKPFGTIRTGTSGWIALAEHVD